MRPSTLCLLSILFTVPGCGRPTVPVLARDAELGGHPVLGCWELSEPQGSGFFPLPKQIRLDPVLEPRGQSRFVAHADIDSIYRGPGIRRPDSHWAPYPGREHIYLAWTDGFTGMFARVRLVGDGFEGPAFETSDAGPRTWRRGVIRGSRISCEASRVRGGGLSLSSACSRRRPNSKDRWIVRIHRSRRS